MPYKKGIHEIRDLMSITPQASVKTWIFDDNGTWKSHCNILKHYGFKVDTIIWENYGQHSYDIDVVMDIVPKYTIYERKCEHGKVSRTRIKDGTLI
jgi:hypothetical protein